MSNVLILTRGALGDTIAGTVLVINHNKKNVIDILLPKKNYRTMKIKQLIEKIPYVNSIFEFDEFDKNTSINYNLIYIPVEYKEEWIKLKGVYENQVMQHYNLFVKDFRFFRLEAIARQLNINNYNIEISIDWYNEFYKNYNLSKKSLLLNTKCCNHMNRNYYHEMELKQELTNCGFNVIEMNNDKNICENLHIINQVKYIITVDTGLLWLAKSLGKKPFMIIPEHDYDNRFNYGKLLGVKVLNGRTPKEIVEDFLCSTKILI
jgi:hypothetical protein